MKRSRLFKAALWALALLALYSLVGFVAVPAIAKRVLVQQVAARLHREATVDRISFNPFTLAARVRGLAVRDPAGPRPALSFDELYVKLSLSSVYRRAPVISALRLVKPYISIIRTADNRYNFSDIVDEAAAQPQPSGESAPSRFSLNNIEISDGTIELDDRPEQAHHVVSSIHFAVPFISDLPAETDVYVTPHFEAKINGEPVVLAARTKPFEQDLDTTLELSAENVDIPRYLRYVPLVADFKLTSALLSTRLSLHFARTAAAGHPSVQLDGAIDLHDIVVTETDGRPMLKVPAIAVKIAQVDLSGGHVVLDEVNLPSPEVNVRRSADGTLNLSKLAGAHLRSAPARRAPAQGARAPPPPGSKDSTAGAAPPAGQNSNGGFTILAKRVSLSGATVDVTDAAVGQEPFHTRVSPIDITLEQVGYPGAQPARVTVAVKNDRGTTFNLAGRFTLQPVTAGGTVQVAGLKPRDYAPYWRDAVALDIDDGVVEAGSAYEFRANAANPAAPSVKLSELRLAVHSLRAALRAPAGGDRSELLRIGAFEAAQGSVDLDARTASLGQVSLTDASVLLRRARDGSLDLARLMAPPGGARPVSTSAPVGNGPAVDGAAAPPSAPWSWTVQHAAVQKLSVRLVDQVPDPAVSVRLDPIDLSIDGLSSAAGAKASLKLAARIDKSGAMTASGSMSVNPLSASIRYDVRTVDLVPYQPYVGQYVNIALSSGQFSARGSVELSPPAAKGPLRARVRTSLTVGDFACTDSATSQDLLRWKSLQLGDITVDTAPLSIAVNDISLSDFYSRLILNADGRLNLQGLTRTAASAGGGPATGSPANAASNASPANAAAAAASSDSTPAARARGGPSATEASPADSGAPTPVRIGRISVQAGRVNYSDFFIKPNYTANLTDLTGSVTALSPETPGHIDVRGKVDGSAPVDIEGEINPLAKSLFLDVRASARDIQLSPMTPYSDKYIGYGIEKGTLSLKLAYKVDNGRLEASNNVYLDQLTFGRKVDSPDAIKLPVLLAVALLKDRNGVIDVNLPISGSLNDPQFSIGGVIVRVLMNLVVRAVTSPFALLSSVFGGSGEELSYIEFEPGHADLNEASLAKLKTLAEALKNRPALKLDISGRVDPDPDREALRQIALERSVKVQKFNALQKEGTPAPSVEDVVVSPEEYPRFLALAYRAGSFPKPRNALGMVRDLPVADMEKLILASTDIGEGDLRELAGRRAAAAQGNLIEKGGVDPARIFLVEPRLTAEGIKDNGRKTRADFELK